MRTIRFPLTLCLLLCACQPGPRPGSDSAPQQGVDAMPQSVIHGRATYRERIKMPPGADLVVQLVDNQLADTQQAVIASVQLDDVAGPPYDFTLPYDAARLRANGMYGLHASLRGPDGELWFVTDTRVPVTPGSDALVEFRMVRVPGPGEVPAPAAGSPWDAAKARGIGFRGVGNEPGWFVEVGMGEAPSLHAELDYGARMLDVERLQPLSGLLGYAGTSQDGIAVRLLLERKTCSDGMSDTAYPVSAQLIVGDKTYRGCGRFLSE